MTSESAKMIANLAILQSSNKSEAIAILAEAITEVALITPISTLKTVFKEPNTHETLSHRVEEPKKPVSNEVMVRAGRVASCFSCGKDVYKIVKDVYNTMKTEAFCDCFEPTSGSPKLQPPIDIQVIDDSCLTDCPLCNAKLSLVLWGKPPKVTTQSTVPEVGAIDGENFL